MKKFRQYAPEQVWLLPPSVQDVLGPGHLCFFVHEVVEHMDTTEIENSYGVEGQPGYHPKMLLKVWLYGYCLGVTSCRRLEQRTREDLGFRYLAGGATPDHWTLNWFRRRHARGINDVFTQVVEWARQQGWARLGHVAIDSTRIAANASRDRVVTAEKLRQERAHIRRQIRRWQKQCDQECTQEAGGTQMPVDSWKERLAEIPRQLKQLRRCGVKKLSTTDPDSRFLKQRQGFTLGYTADIAVSQDHLIVAQAVTQQTHDHQSLTPVLDQVQERCQAVPAQVSADSGFYTTEQIENVMARGVDVYVPDSNLARELNGGPPAEKTDGCIDHHTELLTNMRAKLRSAEGRRTYGKRRGLVEPVFGTLKEQRNGRRFRMRGLAKVRVEFCFMALAYNLTRLHRLRLGANSSGPPHTPCSRLQQPAQFRSPDLSRQAVDAHSSTSTAVRDRDRRSCCNPSSWHERQTQRRSTRNRATEAFSPGLAPIGS